MFIMTFSCSIYVLNQGDGKDMYLSRCLLGPDCTAAMVCVVWLCLATGFLCFCVWWQLFYVCGEILQGFHLLIRGAAFSCALPLAYPAPHSSSYHSALLLAGHFQFLFLFSFSRFLVFRFSFFFLFFFFFAPAINVL